ncbi:MAG: InlB B-repeat-containing protein, partial [Lachnospiraceae bacterium]|nr:InlB B-repeat-containing protein [Lachnospiraceae bacterium]
MTLGTEPTAIGESGTGVLTDKEGKTRENYSTYDPDATIKYETDTYFYIDGLDEIPDVSLTEIAEATGKNFNSADTISGFKYNDPAATDSVEINDIIDTLVYMGYGREVKNLYGSGATSLHASSYNTIRAYDAGTGDADSARTYAGYEVSLKYPDDKKTVEELDAFLNDISWGDPGVVRKTALYRIEGVTDYMPVLTPTKALYTNAPVPTATRAPGSTAERTPIPTAAIPTATSTPVPQAGIIYNGNGADGGSTWNSIVHFGGTFTVSANGFYKRGYHDAGYWSDTRDGNGRRYRPGDTVNVEASNGMDRFLVLYAVWSPDEYIVEYDYNAGFLAFPDELEKGPLGAGLTGGQTVNVYSDPYSYTTYVLGEDCAVIRSGDEYELPLPSARGYRFINWSLREMASGNGFWGNYVLPGDRCTTPENHKLYAVWQAETYKVGLDYGFDINETSGEDADENKAAYKKELYAEFGSPYGTLPEPVRTGYVFRGWSIQGRDGQDRRIVNKDTICDTDGDHVLYALWEPLKVRLFFDGADEVWEPAEVIYGERLGDIFPEPHKTGNRFTGWNSDIGGKGETIDKNTVSPFCTDTH